MKQHSILPALLIKFSIVLLLSSCSIQKRTHMDGYSIEWNRNKPDPSKSSLGKHHDSNSSASTKSASDLPKKKLSVQPTDSGETNQALSVSADTLLVADNTTEIVLHPQHKKFNIEKRKAADTRMTTSKRTPMDTVKSTKKEEIIPKTEDDFKKEKNLLSTLWTFVTLNYLYCDIAGLMDAALLSQYLTGVVGGMVISSGFLLAAGILMEIPISMVLFSRILKGKGNRNANIIAGIIMTLVQIATLFAGPVTAYYLFFCIIEIATTAFITWYAWKKLKKKEISEVK